MVGCGLDDGSAGIGSTVVVEVNGRRQVRWMTAGGSSIATFFPQVVHFGFGAIGEQTVDVEVRWSDGSVSEFNDVETNRQIPLINNKEVHFILQAVRLVVHNHYLTG